MRTALARIVLVGVLVLWHASYTPAQESDLEQPPVTIDTSTEEAPLDTLFYEVMLTEDGVTAVDTAGNDWYYDFEDDQFVMGIRPSAGGGREPIDPGYEGLDLPIDERASEQRRVKPYEQRSLTIGYDEFVDGNILASGRVTVKGWVKGDVRSFRRVVVTATGVVDGKVMAPDIDLRPGGVVNGGIQETNAPIDIQDITEPFSDDFLRTIAILSGILLVITFLSTTLMPRQLNNICLTCRHYPVRSSLLGLLLLFLFPLVITLVVVTIVGVLVVPFVPLVYGYALLLGVVASGDRIGGQILRRLGRPAAAAWVRAMVGVVVICLAWTVTAIFTGFDSGVLDVVGILILVAVSTYTGFVMLNGLGAALLTRLGTRPYISWHDRQAEGGDAPSPAPPPRPSAPPVTPPERPAPSPDSGSGEPPKPPRSSDSDKPSPPPKRPESTGSDAPPVTPPPGKRTDSDAT